MDRNIRTALPDFERLMRSNRSVYIGSGYLPSSDRARYRRLREEEGWRRGDRRLETLATRLDGENLCEKSCYNPNLILWPALRRIVLYIGGLGIMAVYGRV